MLSLFGKNRVYLSNYLLNNNQGRCEDGCVGYEGCEGCEGCDTPPENELSAKLRCFGEMFIQNYAEDCCEKDGSVQKCSCINDKRVRNVGIIVSKNFGDLLYIRKLSSERGG